MFVHDHHLDRYDNAYYTFLAGGDITGALPAVTGTFRGAAVAKAHDHSFIADGDVEMTVRLGANPTLDIIIGNWQGYLLNGGEIGSITDDVPIDKIDISDIPISPEGEFYRRIAGDHWTGRGRGDTRQFVRGSFFGPEGQEAAGIFFDRYFEGDDGQHNFDETPGVHGVFGVRRPPDD